MDKIEIPLIHKNWSPWHSFDISTMFSLFGHMVKKTGRLPKGFNLINYHPNIKFTHEFNKKIIFFLDLKVSLSGGQLTTDLHIKSTDKHQYLLYTSAHLDHTKLFIVFSQALRISRILSNEKKIKRNLGDMKSWFQIMGPILNI